MKRIVYLVFILLLSFQSISKANYQNNDSILVSQCDTRKNNYAIEINSTDSTLIVSKVKSGKETLIENKEGVKVFICDGRKLVGRLNIIDEKTIRVKGRNIPISEIENIEKEQLTKKLAETATESTNMELYSNLDLYNYWNDKHKYNRKRGFIVFGAGVAQIIAGATLWDPSDLSVGHLLVGTGIITVAASLPRLFSSASNRNKSIYYLGKIAGPDPVKYQHYSRKHKRLRNAGWITLGSGLALMVAAFNVDLEESYKEQDLTNLLATAGLGAMIVSIPLLSAARANNKKANIYLGTGSVGIKGLTPFDSKYLSVGISIDL